MLKKLGFSGLILALTLGFTGVALASTVDVNGYQIDTDQNTPSVNVNTNTTGSVNVSTPAGQNINVDKSAGQTQVKVNGTTVNATPTSVQVNEGGNAQTDVSQTGGSLNIMVNGANVKVTGSQDLSAVVDPNATLDAQSADTIVSLQNGTATLIKNNDDLGVYASLVAKQRPGVEGISVTNGTVNVAYRQPAKFFGIFHTSLPAHVLVTSTGNVSVSLPWYSFFYSKDTGSVKTGIQTSLSTDESQGLDISGLGASDVSVQAQNGARVINVASTVVNQTASSLNVQQGSRQVHIDDSNGVNIQVQN